MLNGESHMAKKVLVVDDEVAYCETMRDLLIFEGYQAVVVTSGDEALETYPRERPDIVLLDLRMPGKDGISTLLELRNMDPAVNIIVVSAVAHSEEVVRRVERLGALFMHKPVNFKNLQLAIASTLRKPGYSH